MTTQARGETINTSEKSLEQPLTEKQESVTGLEEGIQQEISEMKPKEAAKATRDLEKFNQTQARMDEVIDNFGRGAEKELVGLVKLASREMGLTEMDMRLRDDSSKESVQKLERMGQELDGLHGKLTQQSDLAHKKSQAILETQMAEILKRQRSILEKAREIREVPLTAEKVGEKPVDILGGLNQELEKVKSNLLEGTKTEEGVIDNQLANYDANKKWYGEVRLDTARVFGKLAEVYKALAASSVDEGERAEAQAKSDDYARKYEKLLADFSEDESSYEERAQETYRGGKTPRTSKLVG